MFHSALLLCFRDKLYLGSLGHYLAPSRKGKTKKRNFIGKPCSTVYSTCTVRNFFREGKLITINIWAIYDEVIFVPNSVIFGVFPCGLQMHH